MRRKGPTRHAFVEDIPADIDPITKVEYCGRCHLPSTNAIHDMPQRTDEQRDYERQRMGERDQ